MARGDDARLAQAARRRHEREARWRREGERPLGRNLAMIGAYGWLVAAPMVGGVFLGRWLDRLRGGGIVFTAALVLLGASLGTWLMWRRMFEDQGAGAAREDAQRRRGRGADADDA